MGWFQRRKQKAALLNYMQRAAATPGEIDRNRLALFDIEPSEKPIETLAVSTVCAWPAKNYLPGPPMDHYSDTFFDEPNALMMSPPEMSHQETADSNLAVFGWAHRQQLAIALVTDQRLMWRPIDGSRPAPADEPGYYSVYGAESMSQRWIGSAKVSVIETIGFNTLTVLPYGLSSTIAVRVEGFGTPDAPSFVSGPRWPQFNLVGFDEFAHVSRGAQSVVFFVDGMAELMIDTFLLGCARASLPVEPQALVDSIKQKQPGWQPLHQRLGKST